MDREATQMRPGIQRLVRLLRWQGVELDTDPQEWERTFALAVEEHLLPWASHLCSRQAHIREQLEDRLQTIAREAAIAAFYWSAELKRILSAFEQHNLVVVPLKGPLLAERIYGDAALRINYDLDLLVSVLDLLRAEAVLSGIGFSPGAPDDYHRQWYRGPTTVELHHDVENPWTFDFRVAGALNRVQRTTFQGQPCWQLAPDDELIFLCLHGVRHRFERLSLIVDLQLAFEKLPAGHTWQPRTELDGLNNVVLLGLAMVRRLQPETSIRLPIQTNSKQVAHLEKLADRLWHRLLTERGETLDWRALHAFYVELEMPGWPKARRRLRHLRELSGRLIEPDYRFAARLGLHRPWQAKMLRPLRLLTDFIRN